MIRLHAIPPGPSIFETGCLPTMAYSSHSILEDDGRSRATHSHQDIAELTLIVQGHGIHRIGNREYHSSPGDLLLFNAGKIHDERAFPGDTCQLYCCGITNLHLKGLPPNWLASENTPFLINSGSFYDTLLVILRQLEQFIDDGLEHSSEFAQGALLSILVLLHELVKKADPEEHQEKNSSIVNAMRNYIDQNYALNFTLDELAANFGISRFYASHAFQHQTGYSPLQYRLRRRMGEAQSMLTDTDYSITYIASMVGYDNPNHFSQQFTKAVGLSPKLFRSISKEFTPPDSLK